MKEFLKSNLDENFLPEKYIIKYESKFVLFSIQNRNVESANIVLASYSGRRSNTLVLLVQGQATHAGKRSFINDVTASSVGSEWVSRILRRQF